MSVYVIGHRPVASKVKIGSAIDPVARLRTLCDPRSVGTIVPSEIDRASLELLVVFEDGDKAMEYWLHGEFSKVRAEGEWFKLGSNAAELVRRVTNQVGRYRAGRDRFQIPVPRNPIKETRSVNGTTTVAVVQDLPFRRFTGRDPSLPEALDDVIGGQLVVEGQAVQDLPGVDWAAYVDSRKTPPVKPLKPTGLSEAEIRAHERKVLADLLEARHAAAPNADQREALRGILEIVRPETWQSGA